MRRRGTPSATQDLARLTTDQFRNSDGPPRPLSHGPGFDRAIGTEQELKALSRRGIPKPGEELEDLAEEGIK